MRLRKGRGKQKDKISLTESDIVLACHKYLEDKGYVLSDISYLAIPTKDIEDKLGRKRRRGIEFQVEIE